MFIKDCLREEKSGWNKCDVRFWSIYIINKNTIPIEIFDQQHNLNSSINKLIEDTL